MRIDHLAVAGDSLEEASEFLEEALGVSMEDGGKHNLFGTHNKLLGLNDGLYLECIAIDPDAPKLRYPRWFDLDNFTGLPRLTNWICNCKDIYKELLNFPIEIGPVMDVSRGKLSWKITVPNDGILPFDNLFPALIQWNSLGMHPSKKLKSSNCKLLNITICHPNANKLKNILNRLSDKRVFFERNSTISISAEFDTPSGKRYLSNG